MAESIISPGVYTRENDTSYITPAPIAAGAAFIGPTVKGPDNQPLIVTSYSDYVRKFGETVISGSKQYEFLTSVAVKNYFQNGGQTALVTRVVSGSYTRATNTNLFGTTGVNKAVGSGTIVATAIDGQRYDIVYGSNTYAFIASSTPIPVDIPGAKVFFFSTGSSAAMTVQNLVQEINTQTAYVPFSASYNGAVFALSGSTAGTTYNGVTFLTGSILGEAPASLLFTLAGGTTGPSATSPFAIQTLGKGVIYNNSTGSGDAGVQNSDGSLVSGSMDNIRWEISNVNSSLGTFTLVIRQGDDSTNNKTILETFNNLSLDPNSDNYIEQVIGNQYIAVGTDGSTSFNYPVGEFPNGSNYIRVSAVNTPTLNYLANDGITVNTDSAGVSFTTYLPTASSGSFYGAAGSVGAPATFFGAITTTTTTAQGILASNYTTAISLLSNRDDYQFNIISAPGLIYKNSNFTSTVSSLISLAEQRGDCIAVVDLVAQGDTVTSVTAQATTLNSSYAATYWPWLQIKSATGRNEWTPAGAVIPGVYAFTDASSAPWFAPAGLIRGGIGGVIQAERKLTKGDRDTLYAAKVNPIATFPGSGISIMGQKTLQSKASALDRVNVRRLLIALKKFIGDQARNLVFEQNTGTTRTKFLSIVTPYLESVVQRQGLYAFKVVMDDTNNTADVIDRNQLVGQILIQPTKTVEYVVLDFTIEPTGATFA